MNAHTPPQMLRYALAYARRGVPVLPVYEPIYGGACTCGKPDCPHPGKHPRPFHGVSEATTDRATISKWWEQWPEANIGLATGTAFFVLDIDVKNNGPESLSALQRRLGALPDTVRVKTGGNGTHYYFAVNGAAIRQRIGLAPGIDVRSSGGYVLAPPSRHASGNCYQFDAASTKTPADPPTWLIDLINGKPDAPKERFDTAGALEGLQEGQRDTGIFRLACKLRRADVPFAEALELVLRAAGKCAPPFPEAEARKKAESAYQRYQPAEDRHAAQPPAPGERLSDLGNARRFIARHGANHRYVADWGWLHFDGQRWTRDRYGAAERGAKDTVLSAYAEAGQIDNSAQRREFLRHLIRSESARSIGAMLESARTEPEISAKPEHFDTDPWLFNCANGTLDLRTGDLLPHCREHYITRCSPVTYSASATGPIFAAFLNRIMAGNGALIAFIQRFFGYALTGSTSEQCFAIFHGCGANGKSTLLGAAQHVLGNYAISSTMETFLIKRHEGINNDLARLAGARLVAATEVEGGRKLAESLVKQLCGGDKISARFLHREFFEFEPAFKLVLASNHKPTIAGTDNAIWRRVRLVPFNVTIPEAEQDHDLPAKLKGEAAGILRWMLQGCIDWQRDGLGAPEEVREATHTYRLEQDILGAFLDEACELVPDIGTAAGNLYSAYELWCESNGERAQAQRRFGAALTERGFSRQRQSNGRISYLGLALRPDMALRVAKCQPKDPE